VLKALVHSAKVMELEGIAPLSSVCLSPIHGAHSFRVVVTVATASRMVGHVTYRKVLSILLHPRPKLDV
jgi:hypothetical protein